jgi:hypothetical protein
MLFPFLIMVLEFKPTALRLKSLALRERSMPPQTSDVGRPLQSPKGFSDSAGQLFRRILVDAAAPMGGLVLRIVGRRWTLMSIFEKS